MGSRKTHNEQLEPTLDIETAPMMEPPSKLGKHAPASRTPSRHYWKAQGLASAIHRQFEDAQKRGDTKMLRNKFYILARYYGRTLAILHHAISKKNEELMRATLHNLISLHVPLHHMHEIAPARVPLAMTLSEHTRHLLLEDLIIEVLQEADGALSVGQINERANELHMLAGAREEIVETHLKKLIATGHVQQEKDGFIRTHRAYSTINLDRTSLQALIDPKLYDEFELNGFHGLAEIAGRPDSFRKFFSKLTGFSTHTADLFEMVAKELLGPSTVATDLTPWGHSDLAGSHLPRPYQHDAFAIFKGYGYQGQVIEAPTGSGKTLIGMMCIQEWLRSLTSGESILILVPTVNYQQQWFGELCYKDTGLHLTPDVIFTGTMSGLETEIKETGETPAIMIMTYAALSHAASGLGKGGFDHASIEVFLQRAGVQYVILDEVHKVVEDLRSVSADVTRLMSEWLQDGSLRGLIGFSGTAAAYRQRFQKLGLQLVYTMPAADLIAYGFVAPFTEIGIPFAYSDREQDIRKSLEKYKGLLREYIELLDSGKLRETFAGIPLEDRTAIGRDLLRMYAGNKDRDLLLGKRMMAWEKGDELNLNELALISIIQIHGTLSDRDLVSYLTKPLDKNARQDKLDAFQDILDRANKLREQIKETIFLPDIARRLNLDGFGTGIPEEPVARIAETAGSINELTEKVKTGLALTMAGLYDSLKNFYFRTGEGRLDTIKSIIKAEHAVRPVTGVIIFDKGKRINWEKGLAVPGFSGVAGVFGQMLGERGFVPMAVLSNEIYLPWDEKRPLSLKIAGYIRNEIMLKEVGSILFSVIVQGLDLANSHYAALKNAFETLMSIYVEELDTVHASRPSQFNREVIKRFRRDVKDIIDAGPIRDKLLVRLQIKNKHLRKCVDMFFDYALIATHFIEAEVAELQQISGKVQKFQVVTMASGDRKLYMYDLTARIVDTEKLPVNMIIVSPWARTGWNVIRPNILIDATATRNVTAWQQLRGRAMRAMSSWNQDCYRLVMMLLGSQAPGLDESSHLPKDVITVVEELHEKIKIGGALDDNQIEILLKAHKEVRGNNRDKLSAKIRKGSIRGLTKNERQQLVIELMMTANKVTHIYELVKAYGSSRQVIHDREAGVWRRKDSIAAKHAHEYSVGIFDGKYAKGEVHAPLIYAGDPRTNLPSKFRKKLAEDLKDRDSHIVEGWLKAVTSSAAEGLDLE